VRQRSDSKVEFYRGILKLIVFTSLCNKVTLREEASKSYSRHFWNRNLGDTLIHDIFGANFCGERVLRGQSNEFKISSNARRNPL
jgi:hypothetical protein